MQITISSHFLTTAAPVTIQSCWFSGLRTRVSARLAFPVSRAFSRRAESTALKREKTEVRVSRRQMAETVSFQLKMKGKAVKVATVTRKKATASTSPEPVPPESPAARPCTFPEKLFVLTTILAAKAPKTMEIFASVMKIPDSS